MHSRTRTFSKICSFFIISMLILSASAFGFDNIVQNGEFDNELTDWDIIESPQFSINVVNEQARFNGDGVSLFYNINEDLEDGSLYQTEILDCESFNISGNEISSYITLGNVVTELITNPTFDDDTGWDYTEFGNTAFLDSGASGIYTVNTTNKPDSSGDNYTCVILNQTSIVPVNGYLWAESSHKHYINDTGTINSTMRVADGSAYIVYEDLSNETTDWIKDTETQHYIFAGSYINTTLITNHSLEVGDYINTTKQTSWDNCYVNITTYLTNGSYTSKIIDGTENCSWNQIETFTNFNPTGFFEKQTVYFRTGDSPIYDGTWSVWANVGSPEVLEQIGGIYHNKYNVTGFGQYSQYKIEWTNSAFISKPHKCYGASVGGILVSDNTGTASMVQTISKPYTNYTVVEYDQQILASDIIDCNVTVKFGNNTLTSYNITEANGTIENFSFNVSGLVDPMGDYELNFTVSTTFASPNVTVVRIPIDVVFALDTSGSMGATEMDNLRTATKNLIGLMNETDRVAIFTFDGGGSEDARPLMQEPYAYMTSANKTLYNSTVDSITENGYTCFYDTVGEAINYTQNNKIAGRLEYVIAMTDGESNSDDDWTPEDVWGNYTSNDPNNYDSDNLNQSTKGLKGLLEAPCIVYTIGLGITHDSGYPSAPDWSDTPPDPNTGIEYDVWNVASSSPDLLPSEGGKYGVNETGVPNTGKYFFTDDSADLPSIFESLYGSIYISEVSGINSTCIVNIDNVRVWIPPQAPSVVEFTVHQNNPISYTFNGIFTDFTLNETYEIDEDGIESITIIVNNTGIIDTFIFNVTDYEHIGNGVFEFSYTWYYPPASINATTLKDSWVIVRDTTGNEFTSSAIVFTEPTVLSVLVFVGVLIIIIQVVLVIFRAIKHSFDMKEFNKKA